jgi:hypothetical protein
MQGLPIGGTRLHLGVILRDQDKSDRVQFIARIVVWLLLLAIAVMTDGPISLRPETTLPANVERIAAWAFLGALFAIGYPKPTFSLVLLLVGAAGLLEFAQLRELGRHGQISDFVVKSAGGVLGLGAVRLAQYFWWKRSLASGRASP